MRPLVLDHGRRGPAQPWTLDRHGVPSKATETPERIDAIRLGLQQAGCTVRTRRSDAQLAAVAGSALRAVHCHEHVDHLRRTSGELAPHEAVFARDRSAPRVVQDTAIVQGTYEAAVDAMYTAVDAADCLNETTTVTYALCRPPGHHAGPSWFGGYCFLNNAAAAAHALTTRDHHVGILDLDYHVGNGTAAIVAERPDINYASVHASTTLHYPWQASVPGCRRDLMIELDASPSGEQYLDAVVRLLESLAEQGTTALVVSLGYDTVKGDPHGDWSLVPDDLYDVAAAVIGRGWPTCVVQEGGYNLATLAESAQAFASGCGAAAGTERANDAPTKPPLRSTP